MTPVSPGARCPRCSSAVVTISFRQGDSTMTMTSCAKCRRQTWRHDEEAVDLEGLLASLADSRPRRPLDP